MLRYYILFIYLSVASISIGQDRVNFLSDGRDGTLSLRVIAYGKKTKETAINAELSAIKSILFRGIPGSNQVEKPLVGIDEENIRKEHKKYFKVFFEEQRYSSFILSNIPIMGFAKDATKRKCVTVDIKVNLQALRSDLEQHKVIRKFGF